MLGADLRHFLGADAYRARNKVILQKILEKQSAPLIARWLELQRASLKSGQVEASKLAQDSEAFVRAFQSAVESGDIGSIQSAPWNGVREVLEGVSHDRALQGFSPTETATFVFSLKEPLFELIRQECGRDADALAAETLTVSQVLDQLGLFTAEIFQTSREQIILRQQEEMLELSTPVVQLWDGILALPLIGTLDSSRTQKLMENLHEEIVRSEAEIAIIDITGAPTVDTLVAQHLLKTVSAARLMGADCIISGIRPQIAQTLVHLGFELNVISKASMADALKLAFRRINKMVVDRKDKTSGKGKSTAAEE